MTEDSNGGNGGIGGYIAAMSLGKRGGALPSLEVVAAIPYLGVYP